MAETDALRICNHALLLLGEQPIIAFDEASSSAKACRALYQDTVAALLDGHPWWFAARIDTLARISGTPTTATGFSASYQLPSGLCRVIVPLVGGFPLTDWGLLGDRLYCDAGLSDTVELLYGALVDERLWSPSFTIAVCSQLAASLAMPITEQVEKAQALYGVAQRDLAKARNVNAQEKPAIRLPPTLFTASMFR